MHGYVGKMLPTTVVFGSFENLLSAVFQPAPVRYEWSKGESPNIWPYCNRYGRLLIMSDLYPRLYLTAVSCLGLTAKCRDRVWNSYFTVFNQLFIPRHFEGVVFTVLFYN